MKFTEVLKNILYGCALATFALFFWVYFFEPQALNLHPKKVGLLIVFTGFWTLLGVLHRIHAERLLAARVVELEEKNEGLFYDLLLINKESEALKNRLGKLELVSGTAKEEPPRIPPKL